MHVWRDCVNQLLMGTFAGVYMYICISILHNIIHEISLYKHAHTHIHTHTHTNVEVYASLPRFSVASLLISPQLFYGILIHAFTVYQPSLNVHV